MIVHVVDMQKTVLCCSGLPWKLMKHIKYIGIGNGCYVCKNVNTFIRVNFPRIPLEVVRTKQAELLPKLLVGHTQ